MPPMLIERWRRDPPWVRVSLVVLLAGTAVLYLWGLGASGWANSYYSAAVQAGASSWKAFFFGSSDAANFITVDKAPASLWPMELSARLFGVNAWSILVPQALEGVAAVGLLYATVRRWFSPGAALLAGATLALTPAAALMFRFNNPDALLTLLLTGAAYATVRALEGARTRWLALAFALVGFGFLAKMLQAFLIVPVLVLVYLVAAPTPLRRRLVQLAIGGAALVVSAGWWVAAVMLVPAADRPYIGGSQNNTLLNLMFGYNGFGRLTGNEAGSVGGGGAAGSRWGPTGWSRLFGTQFGGEISWLLPAALLLLVVGVVMRWRAPRTDRARAAFLLWGGWLVVTGIVFSFSKGIIHPYYAVALAPPVGAIVGMGAAMLWRRRGDVLARGALAVALAATALWSYTLLGRTPDWNPGLRSLALVAGLGAAGVVLAGHWFRGRRAVAVAVTASVIGLVGPGAYSVATANTAHSGAIPSAGPAGSSRAFGGGGPPGLGGGAGGGGFGVTGRGPIGGGPPGGGPGGLLNGSTPDNTLVQALESNASRFTWVAAAVRSNTASGYQLATNEPVMAIGGFNGTDPAPTLSQFEHYVAAGQIHYFIVGGGIGGGGGGIGGGGPGGAGSDTGTTAATQITAWVTSHFAARTVGGVTLYDLTQPVA